MDKTELLFIRACKSLNPSVRVKSVYRRFYAIEPKSIYIVYALIKICDKYLKISLTDIINDLNPDNSWKYIETKMDYYDRVMSVLISKIRFAKVEVFPEYKVPRMFKEDKLRFITNVFK